MRSSFAVLAAAGLMAACGSSRKDTPQAPAAASCTSYCSGMATTCTAGDVQYNGLIGDCAVYCAATTWTAGNPGDQSGNSLECRVSHTGLAAASSGATRTLHCGHAGPSGGNACGTWCENYCYLALKNCATFLGTGADQMGFTDLPTCMTACGAFPTGGTINGSGDNVQCRIYHAGAAGTLGPVHCGHAASTSRDKFPNSTGPGPCS